MHILVLGGGQQGRTIAEDLAAGMPAAKVDVADVRPGAGTIQADLSDPATLVRLLAACDVGVGALPSRLGFAAMRAAIEARRNYVDLSFCAEDALSLDAEARRAGIAVVPDAGLAPGISNLVVGRFLAEGPIDALRILVGGIAEDPKRPYGYVVTWSVDDLLEEYTRPARIVRGWKAIEVPVLSGLESVDVPGVGTLEAFYSDGLRSLLSLDVPDMEEKTLRWPSHVAAIRPLLAAGTLVETIRRECTAVPARDVVVLRIEARRGKATRTALLVDRFDGRRTAMTRTTALTTAAVARLVAAGGVRETGVVPLERVGRDRKTYDAVIGDLKQRGVNVHR